MKRISRVSFKCLVLIFAIVSSVPSVVQARNQLPPGQRQLSQATLIATVNVAKLNVRRAPRITSSIIGTYGKGEEILLIGRTQGSTWLQVSTDFGIGWILGPTEAIWAAIWSATSRGRPIEAPKIEVAIRPGQMALTRMLVPASCCAAFWTRLITPAWPTISSTPMIIRQSQRRV